jgi:type I restriction enzyme, S subunit
MTGKIDISPEQLAIVQGILRDHLPMGTLAWAFGSRVTWTAKPFSDLDIALEGAEPLPSGVLIDLAEAFEASDLPWKVDVIDLNAVSPEFRAIVERQRVPADWASSTNQLRTDSLDDICELIADCPHSTPKWTDSGHLVIRNQNIRNGRLDLSEKSYTNHEDYLVRVRRAVPQAGDLIFTREAPMGEICQVPAGLECCLGQRQVLLRPAKGVYSNYLLYAMQSPFVRHQIFWNEGTGSTVSNVRIPVLKKIEIPRHGDSEHDIAHLLKTLDDKIELNRRMNETLEALARAVFRDWFVDFGPTRRKAAGITDPAAILGGLLGDPEKAAQVAALFPDSFGADGLPEGWEIRKIDEILTRLKVGKLYDQKSALEVGSVPILDQGKQGIIGYHNNEPNIFASKDARVAVFANHTCVQRLLDFDFSTIQNVIPFVGKGFPTEWCFYATLGKQAFEEYKGHWPTFVAREVVVPSLILAEAFSIFVAPSLELSSHNEQENQTLAATRDLLLPKLMSGEIRLIGTEGVA